MLWADGRVGTRVLEVVFLLLAADLSPSPSLDRLSGCMGSCAELPVSEGQISGDLDLLSPFSVRQAPMSH